MLCERVWVTSSSSSKLCCWSGDTTGLLQKHNRKKECVAEGLTNFPFFLNTLAALSALCLEDLEIQNYFYTLHLPDLEKQVWIKHQCGTRKVEYRQ